MSKLVFRKDRVNSMSIEIILLLFISGIIAGMVNAVAGGATLLTFPVLMASGLPPTVANASNFVALLPSNAAALPVYKNEIMAKPKESFWLCVLALAGGAIGSILLLKSTDTVFLKLVPWLVLIATLLFAFGKQINAFITALPFKSETTKSTLGYFLMFAFSIYGGYFGAGIGVIVLAVLTIIGYLDFHEANALKNLTISAISLLGVFIFAFQGLISWPSALIMMAGATIGGYYGATLAKKIPQTWLKRGIIVFGLCLSAYYFLK